MTADSTPTTCRHCGGKMKPGLAYIPTMIGHPDFPGDTGNEPGCTMSEGPGGLGAVMKCEQCGHSFTGLAPAQSLPKGMTETPDGHGNCPDCNNPMSLVCDPTGANDYLICFACHDLERRLAAVTKERDDAIALNHMYYRTRHEHRVFAKNAQDQRDDWMKEAQGFETSLAALQRENEGLSEKWKAAYDERVAALTAGNDRLRAALATKDAQIAELQLEKDSAVKLYGTMASALMDGFDFKAWPMQCATFAINKYSALQTECEGLNQELSSSVALGDALMDEKRGVMEQLAVATARAEAAESAVSETTDNLMRCSREKDAALALFERARAGLISGEIGLADVQQACLFNEGAETDELLETVIPAIAGKARVKVRAALADLPVAGDTK